MRSQGKRGALLKGIRVVDLSVQIPGPYCSLILGDLGAEVIKVEPPGGGDPTRLLPSLFAALNRNKKGIVLDLKSDAGKGVLYKLVERADVLLEGFRPGVAQRLGIDYATLKGVNPRLIYCSITGYGQDGPLHKVPGHDINYQGVAGLLSLQEGGGPDLSPLPLADIAGGIFAAISILAALHRRDQIGEGEYIDVSMAAGVLSWLGASLYLALQEANERRVVSIPHYGVFRTKDDKYITLGILHEDHFWRRLCAVVGLEGWEDWDFRKRIEHGDEVREALEAAFLTKKRGEWVSLLQEADIPCAPVLTVAEGLSDPQMRHRRMVFEQEGPSGGVILQSGFPAIFSYADLPLPSPPPVYGGDTEEVLKWLGYSVDEIRGLREVGVIS